MHVGENSLDKALPFAYPVPWWGLWRFVAGGELLVPGNPDISTAVSAAAAVGYYKVSIVTRTKDREILLKRAAQSVLSQSFKDYCWVVVNDGGDDSVVRRVISGCGIDENRVEIISNKYSLGMEAASNLGVNAVKSEYIVIHDDDDSWAPEFLANTVQFLEENPDHLYGGVVSHSTYISELIRDDEVVEIQRKPYQNRLVGVDLEAVLDKNLFPPISFLFRRSIYDSVGGFDETLPVLGDWLFNLEFLLRANIGVLPKSLAFYHHRDRSDATAPEYRNTVVDQVSLHQQYTPIVRNRFLRRNLNQSAVSLGLTLQAQAVESAGAPVSPRQAAAALPAVQQLSRGESDLAWAIAAANAALADRRFSAIIRNRKLSPVPPNGTWSVVLPLLRKLNVDVPPPHDFDDGAYLAANPDVAAAVRDGKQKSGFAHYIMHGRHEGRARPSGEYRAPAPSGGVAPSARPNHVGPVFDSLPMVRSSHKADGFERVLHVAHHEWHGIRQASAYSPGHKLLISAHETLTEDEKRAIAENAARLGVERICFQGYSENMDALLLYLRSVLGPTIKYYMISHVTTAQFDHRFEMVVIAKLLNRLRFGVLDGIASVKPGFHRAIEGFWPGTIINYAPNIPMVSGRRSAHAEVYAPLDVGWRKNLFTNIMAGSLARNVDVVKTANFPNGLESIHDLRKLRLVGYLRGKDLLDEMARSSLTLIATLAECQPMTQLESLAVGTPALTGPLEVEEFANDPLVTLCTTSHLDNPALLAKDIEKIVEVLRGDSDGMLQMIAQHLDRRHSVATRNYADFLEL
ncbi:glycosyltransferase [Novosphingobium sp. ERN07]|uniref:glycosyltransferase n=1 Tax=Novosphingobium sp. ERN07 TaxID=2726187 RepID=UPI0014574C8C|nr:glycosyltransferase [Novosphingobium sp. ERN07]NLR72480.1 glycosyltransferase [Novosphingobium sp. ERN07]